MFTGQRSCWSLHVSYAGMLQISAGEAPLPLIMCKEIARQRLIATALLTPARCTIGSVCPVSALVELPQGRLAELFLRFGFFRRGMRGKEWDSFVPRAGHTTALSLHCFSFELAIPNSRIMFFEVVSENPKISPASSRLYGPCSLITNSI